MAGQALNVFCSEVDRDGSRVKIANSWIYWRIQGGAKLILRADKDGTVLKFTGGDPTDPKSYTQEFVANEDDQVRVAYNIEPTQLVEDDISARLAPFTVKQSLSAALAAIGKVTVAGKGKTVVPVLPKAEIKLIKYRKFLRAVAVTKFGGFPDDVHVKNMDLFLSLNYGAPGAAPQQFRGQEARGFREELRRVVPASGPGPLDVVRDIKIAADSLGNDDAHGRVVALLGHSSDKAFGRQLRGNLILDALLDTQLQELGVAKADFDLKRANLKRAQDRLAQAKAANDQDAIEKATLEVQSRQDDLNTIDPSARKMLQAFADAADALEKSHVDVVELQSCGTVAQSPSIASFDFLSRFSRFLSKSGHSVQVKGHKKAIFSELKDNIVDVWLGGPDKTKGAEQESTTSLPLP